MTRIKPLQKTFLQLTAAYASVFVVAINLHAFSEPSKDALFGNVVALNDAELDQQRGGMELPNGMDVRIGIELSTRVNGDVVLRSVLSSGESAAGQQVNVFTGGANAGNGPVVAINGAASFRINTGANSGVDTAQVRIEPTATGISITPNTSPNASVELMVVPVTQESGPVTTAFGNITLQRSSMGTTVSLVAPDLVIQHMIGTATGQLVANTANNRVIDNSTVFNVDIANASPALGSSLMQVNAAAIASARITDF
jgi:hypothetical protein